MKILAAKILPAPKSGEIAFVNVLDCSRSADCDLAARGQCTVFGAFFQRSDCAHGQLRTVWGPKKTRSKKHDEFIAAAKQTYAGLPEIPQNPANKIARTGDYIYLPYSFMGGVITLKFSRVLKSEFTARLIVKLCAGQPVDGMGYVIPEYQKKTVPEFVRHLLTEGFEDLLEEAAQLSPLVAKLKAAATQVGRTVLLSTTVPNVGTFNVDGKDWTWDGVSFSSVGAVKCTGLPLGKVVLQITDLNFKVKITDDRQVSSQTQYVD